MTSPQLAFSNLLHDKGRSAISIIGAGFAVVLIFMQLGFLGALENTATLFYGRLDFDLVVISSEYLDFARPGTVRRDRLAQAQSVAGVKQVMPLTVYPGLWRNPTNEANRGGQRFQITMIGLDPSQLDQVFGAADSRVFANTLAVQQAESDLARLNTVYIDERSRPDFGPLEQMPPGTQIELNGRLVELTGRFRIGTGFSYTGLLLMNEETLQTITARPSRTVSFGLIQLEPGADANAITQRLYAILPDDVMVMSRADISELERDFWISKTAVGKFFWFGVILAFIVGAIFVYQMMMADIKKNLPEYATLKAMGYRFSFLFGVVFWQAVYLAVSGFTIGFALSLLLYEVTRQAARLPVEMTTGRLLVVLILTVTMCIGSGLIAVRKVKTADPADLF